MAELNAKIDTQNLAKCCEQVEALAEQLAAAIQAIASNRLTSFEQSIEAQQRCLAKLLLTMSWINEARRDPTMSQTQARLCASVKTLVSLNKQYSALIEHTSRSLHMLQAVGCGYVSPALHSGLALGLTGSTSRSFVNQPGLSWQG